MDIDFITKQLVDLMGHPNARFNLEPMVRDILTDANENNQSTAIEVLKQRTEEVDAFRQSTEFWRYQYLAQAAALSGFEPKAIEMKIIDLGQG